MIRLKFKERALFDLRSFIRHYEEAFFELYKDSGLWSEDLIIQTYHESARQLYLTILAEIQSKLMLKKVLGRKTLSDWHELNFHAGGRLIVVFYSDDRKRKTRFVESVGIDRRPIIF